VNVKDQSSGQTMLCWYELLVFLWTFLLESRVSFILYTK